MPSRIIVPADKLQEMISFRAAGKSWDELHHLFPEYLPGFIAQEVLRGRPELKRGSARPRGITLHGAVDYKTQWKPSGGTVTLPATGSDFIRPLTREELCGSGRRKTVAAPLEHL